MQLYALRDSQKFKAQENLLGEYLCPECLSPVKLGRRRPFHFLHLTPNPRCSQSGKSITHLLIQELLQSSLPEEGIKEAEIEAFIPELGRIVDLFWPQKKLVFTILTHPLPLEEGIKLLSSYLSCSLQPIWLLHTRQFNREKLPPLEEFLRTQNSCYYVQLFPPQKNPLGRIYDQFEICHQGKRLFRGPLLPVTFRPLLVSHFQGDLQDRLHKNPLLKEPLQKIQNRLLLTQMSPLKHTPKTFFKRLIAKIKQRYRKLLEKALENAASKE